MPGDFYDKVAKKFGKYSSGIEYIKECPDGDPEEIFKDQLIKHAGKNIRALDVGCADGRFTLQVAPFFKEILAIDTSEGMLSAAKKFQEEAGVTNVNFEKMDFFNNNLPSDSFNLVNSRRGPTDYPEFYRLLKTKGFYTGIRIGNLDTKELKETFGRGQDYDKMNTPVLESDSKRLKDAGFDITFAREYSYSVYYKSIDDLSKALESVPIFEDYDPVKDRENLEKYAAAHTTPKGIHLPRHRVVFVAIKH
ncbi:MAG TPA: class I SAM-dependent methyltransferase [Patescibacteria group bacterium]|nr:class I SAM-dependent methyltransferase [Patescibacteria group bacterium]